MSPVIGSVLLRWSRPASVLVSSDVLRLPPVRTGLAVERLHWVLKELQRDGAAHIEGPSIDVMMPTPRQVLAAWPTDYIQA